MKYKKKPLIIDAIQWNGLNLKECVDFAEGAITHDIFDASWKVGVCAPVVYMQIKTPEGDLAISKNDYIIKGIKGEFYPCKPDIFESTYDLVLED